MVLLKKVWFADDLDMPLTRTWQLPPNGSRGLEPGPAERMRRVKALKNYHGIVVSRRKVDHQFGEDGRKGTVGKYTPAMAQRNLWHMGQFGKPWYKAAPKGDGTVKFKTRYPRGSDARAQMIAKMAANKLSR